MIENVRSGLHFDITSIMFCQKHLRNTNFNVLFIARPSSVTERLPTKTLFMVLLCIIRKDFRNLFSTVRDVATKVRISEIVHLNDFCLRHKSMYGLNKEFQTTDPTPVDGQNEIDFPWRVGGGLATGYFFLSYNIHNFSI